MSDSRESSLVRIIGQASYDRLRGMRCLIVGAGGIGCELLKDCILMELGEIHIVDMDTIDLSNLNRQFLFRQRDIKQPKSTVAVNAVGSFSNSKLVPYQANIMDTTQFPLKWFRQFHIIYNGLDNLPARRYINRIAQFTSIPLIESGTSGFDGYIQPIIPGKTECFDCTTKETPKTFPVCTIRSTPSQPIHCIAWAKNFLFHQLFTFDNTCDEGGNSDWGTDDQKEIERIKQETNELNDLQHIIESQDELRIKDILIKLFVNDIEKLLKIENLWKTRRKPLPLESSILEKSLSLKLPSQPDINSLWSIEEQISRFVQAIKALMKRVAKEREDIEFDKDDQQTLEFVATAANIRSYIFNIPMKTVFDIKQIAGNIIPAIATTNAIIAGLSTLTSLRVLNLLSYAPAKGPTDLNMAFTAKASNLSKDRYISNPKLAPPNPNCPVCSRVKRGVIRLTERGLSKLTLQDFTKLLREKYEFPEEVSLLDTNDQRLLYDYDFDDLETWHLSRLKLRNGSILLFSDEEGDGTDLRFKMPIELYLEIVDQTSENEISLPNIKVPYVTVEKASLPELDIKPISQPRDATSEQEVVVLDEEEDVSLYKTSKRTLSTEEATGVAPKKQRPNTMSEGVESDDIIELD